MFLTHVHYCIYSRVNRSAYKLTPFQQQNSVNPSLPTLKPQGNRPLYSNTVIGTLAVDGWALTFGTARRGLGGLGPRSFPSSVYQM